MNQANENNLVLTEMKPEKIHTGSILRVARYFMTVKESTLMRSLAEKLRSMPNIPAVAVIDDNKKALGIIRTEKLFAILGKPFGLEILGKCTLQEALEDCSRFPSNAELFKVAIEARVSLNENDTRWFILEDNGKFAGIFSASDLSNYLSGITQQDVNYAGTLQERLIAGHGDIKGNKWRFEAWSRSAKGIGGDFYYSKVISEDEAFFSLCDISGKGVSASVLVSLVWGMIRMHDHKKGTEHLIKELNSAVVEAFHMEKYLTGFFINLNRKTLTLNTADMGHAHIMIYRNGTLGKIKDLKTNLPIGLENDIQISFGKWSLQSGDVIFVYSDGFPEQENNKGIEFGESRLRTEVLKSIKDKINLRESLPIAFDNFKNNIPQQDDISFIALYIE